VDAGQVLLIFAIAVAVLLVIDLFIVHRHAREIPVREAAIWSAAWIGIGVLFGVLVIGAYVPESGEEVLTTYFSAYLVEKSLSVDNVFLFVLVFTAFSVPAHLQHRVLFYGVLGAILMRTATIWLSASVIERFGWILYIAGAFLIIMGFKLWRERNEEEDALNGEAMLRRIRRVIPTTDGFRDQRFVVREGGVLLATPLLTVLIFLEVTDFVLALDALPAALSISQDPVIVATASVFALLGLRSLYFLLAGVIAKMKHMKAAVALILIFIGGTLLAEQVSGLYHPSALQSLAVITLILVAAVVFSVRDTDDERAIAG
jgi:tellurite resistance protein TerC